jgi:hypothetical protein
MPLNPIPLAMDPDIPTPPGMWIEHGRVISDGAPNTNETAHWITVDFDDNEDELTDVALMEKFVRAIRASECTLGYECEHHFRPFCISIGISYNHDCRVEQCAERDMALRPGSTELGCRDGILVSMLELAVDIQRRVIRGAVAINRELLFRDM